MREILPGVHHWSAHHDPIGASVSSYFVEPAGIVIDPKVPEEEGGLAALPGTPQQIVLTSGHHDRDAQQFADAFGIPIRASREADAYLGGALTIEPFADGEEIAPGVTAIHVGVLCDDEGALHLAVADGAIAFADALHHSDDGLGFFPDNLLGDDPEAVKTGLKERFRDLLGRDFDSLLFAHGEPLVGGGKAALEAFAAR